MAPWFSVAFVASLVVGAEAAHIGVRKAKDNMVPKYASFPRHIKRQAFTNNTTPASPPQVTPVPVDPVTPLVPATPSSTNTADQNPIIPGQQSDILPPGIQSVLSSLSVDVPPILTPSPSPSPASPTPPANANPSPSDSASDQPAQSTPPPIIPIPISPSPSPSPSLPVSPPASPPDSVSVPPASVPPASVPPASVPPVSVPPESVPPVPTPTDSVPPASVPPASVPSVSPPVSVPDTVPPVPSPSVSVPVSVPESVPVSVPASVPISVPASPSDVVSIITGADGSLSSVTVPPVVAPSNAVSVVTGADGSLSSVTVPPIVAPSNIVSVVTGADGSVSSIIIPPAVAPTDAVSVVTGADGSLSSVTIPPVVAPSNVVSVITGADGSLSSITVPPVVAPSDVVSAITGPDGSISSITIPPVVPIPTPTDGPSGIVAPSLTLGPSAELSMIDSILSTLLAPTATPNTLGLVPSSVVQSIVQGASLPISVTGPVPTDVLQSILSQVSASPSLPFPLSDLTTAISVPPVPTTLSNGVVTTLPGSSVPTVLPAPITSPGSETGSGATQTASPPSGSPPSSGSSPSGSAAAVSESATGPSASGSPSGPQVTASGSQSGSPSGSQATASGSQSGSPSIDGTVPSPTASGPPAANSPSASGGSSESPIETPPPAALLFTNSGPTSIQPTGTDTLTAQYQASTIVADSPSSATLASSQYGIPTTLPQIIAPPNSGGVLPSQPPNTTLVQFAFTRPLNYPFVISHGPAIQEIFTYLPVGIAYGLSIENSGVTMQSLQPFDTTATQGFITTLAFAYIPSDMVNLMSLQLTNPASRFHHYDPESSQVFQLITYINTAFPLMAGGNLPGGPGSSVPGAPGSTQSAMVNVVDPLNNGQGSSSVNPTSIGIGFAVVGGAALYGAAMFFVARRYRKRRSVHGRSPSIIDTSSMAQSHGEMVTGAGAALMSGGRGLSGDHDTAYYGTSGRSSRGSGSSRGRDISAPVMAENSLGWN